MLTLILGGARSGKSRFAQSLCASSAQVIYIATARAEDATTDADLMWAHVSLSATGQEKLVLDRVADLISAIQRRASQATSSGEVVIVSNEVGSGVETVVFGDLFLGDIRRYRERLLERFEMKCLFPLWRREMVSAFTIFCHFDGEELKWPGR